MTNFDKADFIARATQSEWEWTARTYGVRIAFWFDVNIDVSSEGTSIGNLEKAIEYFETLFGDINNQPIEAITISTYTSTGTAQPRTFHLFGDNW